MNQKEKELFKSLCSFKAESFDEALLEAATPQVLGHLFFNRMQGVAYGTLQKHKLLGKVNREFRNSLQGAYLQNVEKNKGFFQCVDYLKSILASCGCPYAMLKGAYLCKQYPIGYRTSNDIDLLVHPKDITKIGNALLQAGFRQGNIRSGKFQPATRKEIIESRIMRGETVPYVKEMNMPGMQFLEVDINFSLDYKPGDTEVLEAMLQVTEELGKEEFFLHLCSHLYKEATTLPWVEMMRDMTLYKYCDIYMLLQDEDKAWIDVLFTRAKALGMEKICAFAVLQTNALFYLENPYAVEVASAALQRDPYFLHTVVSPKEQKRLLYMEKNIEARFFADDRRSLLQEVSGL